LIQAKAVIGFWPANTINSDDIEVYSDDDRSAVKVRLNQLRQQVDQGEVRPSSSLADFVAPIESGLNDYIGGFAVTTGVGVEELAKQYEANHDDYNSIMIKALADRLAEALAEQMHKRVRTEYWGYCSDENLSKEDLIREKYEGIRPAPGYPACPDHTEKQKLFELLQATPATGISLTEHFAMFPAASVSGFYFSHPDSRYFAIGKISKDQVENYADRKGMSVQEIERWLSSNLNYES